MLPGREELVMYHMCPTPAFSLHLPCFLLNIRGNNLLSWERLEKENSVRFLKLGEFPPHPCIQMLLLLPGYQPVAMIVSFVWFSPELVCLTSSRSDALVVGGVVKIKLKQGVQSFRDDANSSTQICGLSFNVFIRRRLLSDNCDHEPPRPLSSFFERLFLDGAFTGIMINFDDLIVVVVTDIVSSAGVGSFLESRKNPNPLSKIDVTQWFQCTTYQTSWCISIFVVCSHFPLWIEHNMNFYKHGDLFSRNIGSSPTHLYF